MTTIEAGPVAYRWRYKGDTSHPWQHVGAGFMPTSRMEVEPLYIQHAEAVVTDAMVEPTWEDLPSGVSSSIARKAFRHFMDCTEYPASTSAMRQAIELADRLRCNQPGETVNVPRDDLRQLLDMIENHWNAEMEKGRKRWNEESLVAKWIIRLRAALTASPPRETEIPDALRDVAAERQRQVDAEGWTPNHDDQHIEGELARAAAAYARHAGSCEDARQVNSGFAPEDLWPWGAGWRPSDRRRDLVKAGALILAEIERLDRAALHQGGKP